MGFESREGRAECAIEVVKVETGDGHEDGDSSDKGGAVGGNIPTMTSRLRQVAPVRKVAQVREVVEGGAREHTEYTIDNEKGGAPQGQVSGVPVDLPQVPAGDGRLNSLKEVGAQGAQRDRGKGRAQGEPLGCRRTQVVQGGAGGGRVVPPGGPFTISSCAKPSSRIPPWSECKHMCTVDMEA